MELLQRHRRRSSLKSSLIKIKTAKIIGCFYFLLFFKKKLYTDGMVRGVLINKFSKYLITSAKLFGASFLFLSLLLFFTLQPNEAMAASATVSGKVIAERVTDEEAGTTEQKDFEEQINIQVIGNKYKSNITTNSSGEFNVSLPCEDTYSLVINEETTSAIKRWWQSLWGIAAAGSTKYYLVGEANVDLRGSGCSNKTQNIIVQEIELTVFEATMIKAVNSVLNMISFGIGEISKWIHKALISGNDIEESAGAIDVWKTTRNVSISLLTLVLVIAAFANILSISPEKYGATRLLPKIIFAIGMAYFSFLIAAALLDMMSALQALLFEQAGGAYFQVSMETTSILVSGAQAAARIPELIFLIILGIGLLIAALWLMLVLVVRNAMLFILVGVAPIAFVASALPFTEKYYNQWWSSFWKWGLIGPGVAFMLWLTTVFLGAFTQADLSERWFFLIGAAVMMVLAATLPIKLGGEVYKQVQKAGGKAAGVTGLKARYEEFSKGRKEYANLKAKKDANALRTRVSRSGKLGGVIAGTRGVFGQDFDVAKQMYAAQHKEDDQKKIEERLTKLGNGNAANADLNNPEVVALLEKIATEVHVSGLGDSTKQLMATATAFGSGSNPANENLQNVARKIESNPNKEASIELYNHATSNNYINSIEATSMDAADALEKDAIKKAAKKTVFERGEADMRAIMAAESRGARTMSPNGGAEMAYKTRRDDRAAYSDPANRAKITEKTNAKTLQEQEKEWNRPGGYYS